MPWSFAETSCAGNRGDLDGTVKGPGEALFDGVNSVPERRVSDNYSAHTSERALAFLFCLFLRSAIFAIAPLVSRLSLADVAADRECVIEGFARGQNDSPVSFNRVYAYVYGNAESHPFLANNEEKAHLRWESNPDGRVLPSLRGIFFHYHLGLILSAKSNELTGFPTSPQGVHGETFCVKFNTFRTSRSIPLKFLC